MVSSVSVVKPLRYRLGLGERWVSAANFWFYQHRATLLKLCRWELMIKQSQLARFLGRPMKIWKGRPINLLHQFSSTTEVSKPTNAVAPLLNHRLSAWLRFALQRFIEPNRSNIHQPWFLRVSIFFFLISGVRFTRVLVPFLSRKKN